MTSSRVRLAFRRTRTGVLWMGCAYLGGALLGMLLAHAGHAPSLAFRDRIVTKAQASSPILRYLNQGNPAAAAALDFGANLIGATATAAAGWLPPAPLPIAVYRGWIGGIVSVDGRHRSRFRTAPKAAYYSVVLGLQLMGYILAGGAGVSLGLARVRKDSEAGGSRVIGIPIVAIRDAGYIYLFVIPIFAIASTVEFLWTT